MVYGIYYRLQKDGGGIYWRQACTLWTIRQVQPNSYYCSGGELTGTYKQIVYIVESQVNNVCMIVWVQRGYF